MPIQEATHDHIGATGAPADTARLSVEQIDALLRLQRTPGQQMLASWSQEPFAMLQSLPERVVRTGTSPQRATLTRYGLHLWKKHHKLAAKRFWCAGCRKTFRKGQTDAQATKELEANFPGLSKDDCNMVCDDCYTAALS